MTTAQRLPERALSVIRINRAIWLVVPLFLVVGSVAGFVVSEMIYGVVLIIAAVAFVAAWWWWTGAFYRSIEWLVDADTVQRRGGVVVHSHSVLPRARVQNVTRTSGPVQRWKSLATLTVHSAGAHTPDIVIANIDETVADEIRSSLLPTSESEASEAAATRTTGDDV